MFLVHGQQDSQNKPINNLTWHTPTNCKQQLHSVIKTWHDWTVEQYILCTNHVNASYKWCTTENFSFVSASGKENPTVSNAKMKGHAVSNIDSCSSQRWHFSTWTNTFKWPPTICISIDFKLKSNPDQKNSSWTI